MDEHKSTRPERSFEMHPHGYSTTDTEVAEIIEAALKERNIEYSRMKRKSWIAIYFKMGKQGKWDLARALVKKYKVVATMMAAPIHYHKVN